MLDPHRAVKVEAALSYDVRPAARCVGVLSFQEVSTHLAVDLVLVRELEFVAAPRAGASAVFSTFNNPGSSLTLAASRADAAVSGRLMLLPLRTLGPLRWALAAFDGVRVGAVPEVITPWAGPFVNVAMTL